jgi:16S rRNA (cytosine1402-N4)-methyltransferase
LTSIAASSPRSDPAASERPGHVPVLLREVLDGLSPRAGGIYVDGTVGLGGHAAAIIESCPDIKMLIGLDWDSEAIELAGTKLKRFGSKVLLVQGNFTQIPEVLSSENIDRVDGIVLDLGISSFQLDASRRGFSFLREEPLDMRMDRFGSVMASDMVNRLPVDRLEEVIRLYGEERWARRIARSIGDRRRIKPILSSADLARVVAGAIPRRHHPRKIHPATRTFQALRISVNRELDNLKEALDLLPLCLRPGGRLCIISFHSLEDRIVKDAFRGDTRLKALTKKPLVPGENEVSDNPRARSAKLRIAERLAEDSHSK